MGYKSKFLQDLDKQGKIPSNIPIEDNVRYTPMRTSTDPTFPEQIQQYSTHVPSSDFPLSVKPANTSTNNNNNLFLSPAAMSGIDSFIKSTNVGFVDNGAYGNKAVKNARANGMNTLADSLQKQLNESERARQVGEWESERSVDDLRQKQAAEQADLDELMKQRELYIGMMAGGGQLTDEQQAELLKIEAAIENAWDNVKSYDMRAETKYTNDWMERNLAEIRQAEQEMWDPQDRQRHLDRLLSVSLPEADLSNPTAIAQREREIDVLKTDLLGRIREATHNPVTKEALVKELLEHGYSRKQISSWFDYAEQLENADFMVDYEEKWKEKGADMRAGQAIRRSTVNSLLGGLGAIGVWGQKVENAITGKDTPLDFNSPLMRPSVKAQAIREGKSEDIEKRTEGWIGSDTAFGNLYSGAFNLGASMADSAVIAGLTAVGVPAWAGSLALGSSAASSAMRAAEERGLPGDKALLLGTISGLAEMFFEKYSVESLLNNIDRPETIKQLLKQAAIQGGIETTEEGFTTIVNAAADMLISGNLSEYEVAKRNYMASGMSEEEASKRASSDWLLGLTTDLIGGFISGGTMTAVPGSIKLAINSKNANRSSTTPTKNTMDSQVAAAMADMKTPEQRRAQADADILDFAKKQSEPTVLFTDGTRQTREQFVQNVMEQYPNTTEQQANAAFDRFLNINERGGKVKPIERQKVQDVNPGNVGDMGAKPAMGAADAGFSPYSHAQLEYGTFPPGENPARVVDVPKSMDGKTKVMQTVRTIMEADATPDSAIPELENAIVDGKFSRMPITDQEASDRAEATIRRQGYQATLGEWMAEVRNGKVSKDSIVVGETLYNAAVNAGDTKSAIKIAIQLSAQSRSAAQALQAVRMLKKMSPAAQLYGVKQSVDNLQKTLTDKYGSRAPELVINEELAAKLIEAETAKTREAAEEAIYKDIAQQIPATFADKWNAWRYLSMLGNVRTHARNVLGNAMFAPVRFLKNKVGAGVEAAAQGMGIIDQRQRTKAFGAAGKELMNAAKADYANVEKQILSSGKYNSASDIINKNRTIFKTKAIETLRKGNSDLLEWEDSWFTKSAYASSLASFLKARGYTAADFTGDGMTQAQKDEARAYAIKEAQKATYRDINQFSEFVSSIGFKAPGDNTLKRGVNAVIEGTMPFKNTPANILARSVEYSPVGLVKALFIDSKRVAKGKITAAEYMDRLSSGLTGTALVGLGYLLSNLGVLLPNLGTLRGGTPEDEEQYDLEGRQPYSLEIGNTSITLDWLAPEAMPVFMGVELAEAIKEGGGNAAFTDKLESFLNGISGPMLEMSMMSSLQDALESTEYADNKVVAFLANGALGYLKQALPTLFGQLERALGDPVRETTFLDKGNKFLGTDEQYAIASAANKIPIWDYNQIPYIDAWGRTEDMGGVGTRLFNNLLNPAYVSKIQETPVDSEIKRLEKVLGGNWTPSRADSVITVNGRQEILTDKEFVTYAQAKGQNDLTFRQNLIDSDAYKGLDVQTKAKAMEFSATLANVLAVQEAGFKPKLADWQEELIGADAETITNTLISKAVENQLGTGAQRYEDLSEFASNGNVDDIIMMMLNETQKTGYEDHIKSYNDQVEAENQKAGKHIKDPISTDLFLDMLAFNATDAVKSKRDSNGDEIKGETKKDHIFDWIDEYVPYPQKDAMFDYFYETDPPKSWTK